MKFNHQLNGYILILSVFLISSCQKQVDYSDDINNLYKQAAALRKTTDSLTNILANTNNNLLNQSKTIDSIKNQLGIIIAQINTLNTQLNATNVNIASISAQISILNQQYASLLAQLNTILVQMPSTLSDGLEAWYPFSGNANDSSGNGNHGTVNGAVLTADRFGKQNNSYSLPSLNDYISVINKIPFILNNSISISVWFMKEKEFSYSSLYIIGNGTYYNSGFNISLDQNDNASGIDKYRLAVNISNGPSTYIDILKTELQKWSHIVGLYDGSKIKLYFNGELKATSAFSGRINSPNLNLIFADWDNPSTPNSTDRKIDDIRIYNRALTQSEITYLATH